MWYGYQGAEEDLDQLKLTDKHLQAVLVVAQVVCVGQPMLIAGDLNADPAVIPCLAEGISAGRFVDLALAFSRGAGTAPAATCRFNLEGGAGTRRDFLVGCPCALAASDACFVTDTGSLPTFLYLLAIVLMLGWMLLACWLDTPDRFSSSSSRVVQDVWDVFRDELGVVLDDVVLALGDVFCSLFGVGVPRMGYFALIPRLVVPLRPAALPFLVEVCCVFVAGVWEVELLVAVVLVGCIGPVRVMSLMCNVLSTLLTPLSLLWYSFAGALSLLRMCLKVSGIRVLLSLGGMLFLVILGCCTSSWSVWCNLFP